MRQRIAQRSQAVAVEFCSHPLAIGKDHRCGAIPRLRVLRQSAQGGSHIARKQRIFLISRGHHRQQRFFRRKSIEQPQLKTIVKTRGVTDVIFQNRKPRPDFEPFPDFPFFGAQPSTVRHDGVDLAVVRDVAERLR